MQDVIPAGALAEFTDALFQAAITLGLAGFALVLYRKIRERWVLWWAAAWGIYAVRLGAMASFLMTGRPIWFFWHQVATGLVSLAILWSALTISDRVRWRQSYILLALFPPIWGWITTRYLDRFMLMAVPMVIFLAVATMLAGWAFWRHARYSHSGWARFVAVVLFLWGLHRIDYLFLRAQGSGLTWSYYLDILFQLMVGIGFGLMALSEFAARLETRTADLAHLSALMVRQHENERRRLSRDLHDETAQTLSAVKLEVGMLREGADPGSQERLDHVLQLVDDGIRGIRRVMNDLRPALLDDLGLGPAIHSLATDVRERSRLKVTTQLPEATPRLEPDVELALFRAAQEGLANVVRHARATAVTVRLEAEQQTLRLTVADNGVGLSRQSLTAPEMGHLGLPGLRERIGMLGGKVAISSDPDEGVTLTVEMPASRGSPADLKERAVATLGTREK